MIYDEIFSIRSLDPVNALKDPTGFSYFSMELLGFFRHVNNIVLGKHLGSVSLIPATPAQSLACKNIVSG